MPLVRAEDLQSGMTVRRSDGRTEDVVRVSAKRRWESGEHVTVALEGDELHPPIWQRFEVVGKETN